jgi:hypothetical protein
MTNTLIALIVAPLMLVGCVIPVAKYEQWGRMTNELETCKKWGYLDSKTYTKGKMLLRNKQAAYSVDQSKLDEAYQAALLKPPTPERCDEIVGLIEVDYDMMLITPAPSVSAPQPIKTVSTTSCGKVGNIVTCNTY